MNNIRVGEPGANRTKDQQKQWQNEDESALIVLYSTRLLQQPNDNWGITLKLSNDTISVIVNDAYKF